MKSTKEREIETCAQRTETPPRQGDRDEQEEIRTWQADNNGITRSSPTTTNSTSSSNADT